MQQRAKTNAEKNLTIQMILRNNHQAIVRQKAENIDTKIAKMGLTASLITNPKSNHRVGWALKCVDAVWNDEDDKVFTDETARDAMVRKAAAAIVSRLKKRVRVLHKRYMDGVQIRLTELTVGGLAQKVLFLAKAKKYGVPGYKGAGKPVSDAEKNAIVDEFDRLNDPPDL